MNQRDFDDVVKATVASIMDLLLVKGGEYAGSEDRLANFKRGAQLTGCTPAQVAFIYLSKHYDAISTYIRDQAAGTTRRRSESITGRIDDAINYLLLIKAIILEEGHVNVAPTVVKQDGSDSGEWAIVGGNLVAVDEIHQQPARGR